MSENRERRAKERKDLVEVFEQIGLLVKKANKEEVNSEMVAMLSASALMVTMPAVITALHDIADALEGIECSLDRAREERTEPAVRPACSHGVYGGCKVTCGSCGHACRRHQPDGHCKADIGNGVCGCIESW